MNSLIGDALGCQDTFLEQWSLRITRDIADTDIFFSLYGFEDLLSYTFSLEACGVVQETVFLQLGEGMIFEGECCE